VPTSERSVPVAKDILLVHTEYDILDPFTLQEWDASTLCRVSVSTVAANVCHVTYLRPSPARIREHVSARCGQRPVRRPQLSRVVYIVGTYVLEERRRAWPGLPVSTSL
jgi:hypothetical protein